jgi:hypothetical protein
MKNTAPTFIMVAGFIVLVVLWMIFAAVSAVFDLITTQPFLLGFGAGVGASALVGHRILLRNRQLERRNREMEEVLDRFIQAEPAG